MGDVILCTPVIDYLRMQHPDCTIDFITATDYAPLFTGDTRLRQVLSYEKNAPHKTINQIKNNAYDKIIDLQNNRRSRALCQATPSKVIGWFDKLHLQRQLLLRLRIDRYPARSSVVERYLKAAGALDSITPAPLKLHPSVYRNGSIEPSLIPPGFFDKPVLGLAPFAAWKNKVWPTDRFAEVARAYYVKGWHVVILGGASETAAGNALKNTICTTPDSINDWCISLVGQTSILQSAAVLSRCTALLCGDTGLCHLARACGIPTAVIYGATTHHFGFFPYGEPAFRIIESRHCCRPCHPHGGNWCWRVTRPCLNTISAKDVIEELEALVPG